MATGIKGDTPRMINVPPAPWTLGDNEAKKPAYARALYRYVAPSYKRVGTITNREAAEALLELFDR